MKLHHRNVLDNLKEGKLSDEDVKIMEAAAKELIPRFTSTV
jgi:hypothetical protein